MAINFNVFTGNFDEVEVPLEYSTSDPVLNGDGDMKVVFKNGGTYLYWKTNGQVFSRRAIPG
jgi:hypothetical protein